MTKQTRALQMAINALTNCSGFEEAIQACKEALAEQPTQEPVAWQALCGDNHYAYGTAEIDLKGYHSDFWQRPLYTHPKQWQGLTAKEISLIPLNENTLQTVENLLRSKNG